MKIRIGTRKSDLARCQTESVIAALKRLQPEVQCEVQVVATTGDKKQGTREASISDKKEWVDELERLILLGALDVAVHSGKDVPVDFAAATRIIPVLKPASPFDVFVSALGRMGKEAFYELPQGSRVGTASVRRGRQLLRLRPDLEIVEYRGNVPTRLEKMSERGVQGIVLAAAGLERLSLSERVSYQFTPEELVPAVAQGVLAVQYLSENQALEAIFSRLSRLEVARRFNCERECVQLLGADCRSSVGVHCSLADEMLHLKVRVLADSATQDIEVEGQAPADAAGSLATQVAEKALEAGAADIL